MIMIPNVKTRKTVQEFSSHQKKRTIKIKADESNRSKADTLIRIYNDKRQSLQ